MYILNTQTSIFSSGCSLMTDEPRIREATRWRFSIAIKWLRFVFPFVTIVELLTGAPSSFALKPGKLLTQYTRTVWTQAQGLPQDTIRAITQTEDGYLWLGTDEGLARFDGYEFAVFTKRETPLPSNSITALSPGRDKALWIGTPNGLSLYRNHQFVTFTTRDGLPDNAITYLREDHSGALWIVAGVFLCRFENGKFTRFSPSSLAPLDVIRAVYEDREQQLWVAGTGGLLRRTGDRFSFILGPQEMRGNLVTTMLEDHNHDLWIAGNKGLILRKRDGTLKRFDSKNGLPNNLVRALWEDRVGNLWAGTDAGLSRLENGQFLLPGIAKKNETDWVKCLFEDREGSLWVGTNSGLNRFRDDPFTTYGRSEGMPSDAPLVVHEDRTGKIWVGYHDVGLVVLLPGSVRRYTTRDGLAGDEVFSIRETRNGDLLIGTRTGFSRMHAGRLASYELDDPTEPNVYDAIEDSRGRLLVAKSAGVYESVGRLWRMVIPGGPAVNSFPIVLSEGLDGSLWAGTYGTGLWRLQDRDSKPRLLSTADGLSSNQIRSLYQDPDGTLWIGTFGGGLNSFRNGVFFRFTARDGLLSDNISYVQDDGKGDLWLSTTRGICRVSKHQLRDFATGRVKSLTPDNYGVEDGLRSAQCAPGYPIGGGGARSRDGRIWFSTSRGLATVDPSRLAPRRVAPLIHLTEVDVDGRTVDFGHVQKFEPGVKHIQLRYTGIHLGAPERIGYAYKLEGLEDEWQSAAGRRVANYNTLGHGRYRFVVRATLPGGAASESSFQFEVLPHFYELAWFPWLCGAAVLIIAYCGYQLRLTQVRSRFELVLQERMRLAREIHDTLAQGFVGIGSQLDALGIKLNGDDPRIVRQHLDVARKMVSHSLTEARRSVMDLRASELDGQSLATAVIVGTQQWVAGSAVRVSVEVSGDPRKLSQDIEHNLLRIAQEAVTNALKHADPRMIWVKLEFENSRVRLRIKDDGRGFEPACVLSGRDGHFGILGMRERAQRLGGELDLTSCPGTETTIEVIIPMLRV